MTERTQPRAVRPARWLLTAAVLCALAAAPASAQQVVVSGPSGTTSFDLATGATRWTSPENLAFRGAMVSADGRLALGAEPSVTAPAVRVIDMATGANFVSPGSFEPRVAHPRDLAFFGLTGGPPSFGGMASGTPARLDLNGLTPYGGCPALQTISLDLSGDGARLFALCQSGQIVMIDTATGNVTQTPLTSVSSFKSNFDGTALVATNTAGVSVQLIDVASAAVLADTGPIGSSGARIQAIAQDRRKAIISGLASTTPIPRYLSRVLDVDTFAIGPTLGVDLGVVSISPDNRAVYAVYSPRFGPGSALIQDLATGAVTASASNFAGSLLVSHTPLPPVVAATVTGTRVDFSWTAPRGSPVATAYTLEVGTASGLSNLATLTLGQQATLSIPGVPPGRYYVRVRGRNVAGVSGASNELVVDVP